MLKGAISLLSFIASAVTLAFLMLTRSPTHPGDI